MKKVEDEVVDVNVEDEIFEIPTGSLEEIKAKVESLKKAKGIKRVVPITVEGDEYDEKPLYVAYLQEPDFKSFSKFQALSANNQTQAMKQLATDCWLDGDKEMLEGSLFLFGLMPQLLSIVRVRRSRVLTF